MINAFDMAFPDDPEPDPHSRRPVDKNGVALSAFDQAFPDEPEPSAPVIPLARQELNADNDGPRVISPEEGVAPIKQGTVTGQIDAGQNFFLTASPDQDIRVEMKNTGPGKAMVRANYAEVAPDGGVLSSQPIGPFELGDPALDPDFEFDIPGFDRNDDLSRQARKAVFDGSFVIPPSFSFGGVFVVTFEMAGAGSVSIEASGRVSRDRPFRGVDI